MAPYSLRPSGSGVAIWALVVCSAGSGNAAVFASAATDFRHPEGLEASVCLLQLQFRRIQQETVQHLIDDSGLRPPKKAQDTKGLDSVRWKIGGLLFFVCFALATLGAVRRRSDGGAAKGTPGKEAVEGCSSQEEHTAEASPEGKQGAECNDLSVRFDFISRLLEDKLDTREINVSRSDRNLLYGLYMQVTCGDVRGARPWVLRPKDRAKWDSWASHRGQSSADAMARYIEVACNAMHDLDKLAGSIGAESCTKNEQSSDLRSRFDKAAGDLEEKMRKGEVDATQTDLLPAYALYKQATCGDNQSAQPWAYNIKLRAKWDSWAALKGMAPSQAMETYIGVVKQLMVAQ